MSKELGKQDRDVELMLRVAKGDNEAFAELYELHSQRVLNIVYRYLGRESEAEDLLQEVFLRIYRAAERYQPSAKFTTWLFQIVANLCLNVRRDRSRRKVQFVSSDPMDSQDVDATEVESDARFTATEDRLERDERAHVVREALQDIPERQRIALILMHYEGASYQEIGDALDMTANAAKQLCHRARESLRKKLDPQSKLL